MASIDGTGAGTITADLEQEVTSDWDIVNVQAYFDDAWYESMDKGEPSIMDRSDEWRDVRYYFGATSNAVYSSAHAIDMDES